MKRLAALLISGVLLSAFLPIVPVAAGDCWRATVSSETESLYVLHLVNGAGKRLGLSNRDVGKSIELSSAPSGLGIQIASTGEIKRSKRVSGNKIRFEDGLDGDYNDLVLKVSNRCGKAAATPKPRTPTVTHPVATPTPLPTVTPTPSATPRPRLTCPREVFVRDTESGHIYAARLASCEHLRHDDARLQEIHWGVLFSGAWQIDPQVP